MMLKYPIRCCRMNDEITKAGFCFRALLLKVSVEFAFVLIALCLE